MEAAIDRIMHTYDLLVNRTPAASDEARVKVTEYLGVSITRHLHRPEQVFRLTDERIAS